MEIGSIYSLSTLEKEQCPPVRFAGEEVVYFSLCREALLTIAIHNSEKGKRVLVPAYTCQTVLYPFQQEGWAIEYYNITNQLRIDTEDLWSKYEAFKPNLCIAHPYYGADLNQLELKSLAALKDQGCILVEDLTQCVFSTQYSKIFDYFTGSYRKWFPIPDGAFLIGKNLSQEEKEENQEFVQAMADAMYLRGTFHQTGDVNVKDISRRVCNIAIGHISGAIVPHKISDLSMTLLSKIDVEATKKQRFTNYKYLYDNLHGGNDCFPVERNFEELTCSPLFFPIYVKDRPALQKKLAQQEIYAPVLWPVHTDTVLINEGIKRIYDEILMLPIDQRYGVEDMKRMIEVIKS